MRKLFLSVVAICMLSSSACWSYPSLLGPTGSGNLPDANVIGQGKTEVAVDYEDTEYGQNNIVHLRGLYGIGPHTEVGLAYNSPRIQSWDASWGINAKYAWSDVLPNTSVAVGANYRAITNFGFTQIYGVATHLFAPGSSTSPAINGSIGAGWTTELCGWPSLFRPFVSIDLEYPSGLNIVADYQFKCPEDSYMSPLSSIVARYPLNKEKTLIGQIGITNQDFETYGEYQHHLMLGASYIFGK